MRVFARSVSQDMLPVCRGMGSMSAKHGTSRLTVRVGEQTAMSTIHPAHPSVTLQESILPAMARLGASTTRRWQSPAFVGILLLAVALFTWNPRATFESSDQVGMAYLVQHNYGIQWMFAHKYGPVLPVLQRSCAEVISHLGLPLTESSYRLPMAGVTLAQVLLTFALMRRIGGTKSEAFAAMACCAVLPGLISNAHLPWNHTGVWLLTGTLALWATLAFFDDRRRWQLCLAVAALCAHCTSSGYAMALPVTLIFAWWCAGRTPHAPRSDAEPSAHGPVTIRLFAIGFVLPCLMALAVIFGAWFWTGQGQIGMMLSKHGRGVTGVHLDQIIRFPAAMWCTQLGYLFGAVAGAGFFFGSFCAWRTLMGRSVPCARSPKDNRRGLLAIWAFCAILPVMLLVRWEGIGYPGFYLPEASYAGALLGVILVGVLYRRLQWSRGYRRGVVAVALIAFLHLAIGSVDACLAGEHWTSYTGIHVGWGSIKPDTGPKAAGWYVRKHVPNDAIIMCLHTNKGMEASLTSYYTDRYTLAGYDYPPDILAPLLQAMRPDVDVIITPVQFQPLVEPLADFECVCTIRNSGQPVRFIYGQRGLSLPHVDEEVGQLNARYAQDCYPHSVPTPLSAPPQFEVVMARYQKLAKTLKQQ